MAANKCATDENTLGSRTAIALDFLLRCTSLAYILEAVTNLGNLVFTLLAT